MASGGKEKGKGEKDDFHSPTSPAPPSLFLTVDRRPPPWYKFLFLPTVPLPLKTKMAAIKILSNRPPELRLLSGLT